MQTLYLLLPEWQGYGLSAAPADGARFLADRLFAGRDVLTIDAPDDESLSVRDGVLGLDSIAPRLARALDGIHAAAPSRIVTIGGTCGVELAPIAWLNDRYAGDLAVLWLDGHADLNTPESSPSGHFHGMVLRTLLGDGPASLTAQLPRPLTAGQVFLVGARDLDPPEEALVQQRDIAVLTASDFDDPAAVIARVRAAGLARVYVHLDLDVVNPADFPSALLPTPGGPSLQQVAGLVREIHATLEVAGLSVVEFSGSDENSRARVLDTLAPILG